MAQIAETRHTLKNGRELVLRSPRVGEGAEILELVKKISRGPEVLTEADEFPGVAEENAWIGECLAHPDAVLIVPVVEGRICGMMDFRVGSRRRISHQGEFGMSVDPTLQGQGVGRLMLQALLDWAAAHPRVEALRLRVHARNTRAIALYRSLGFIEEGRQIRGAKYGDGTYDDVIAMARALK